jgi:hypothetical protein
MDIQEITEKPWFIPAVVGVAASIGGFVAGGIIGLRVGYQARIKEEVTEIVEAADNDDQLEFEFDATVDDLVEIDDPRLTVLIEEETIIEETRYDPNPRNDPRDIRVDGPPMIYVDDIKDNNVFDSSFDHWDYDEEAAVRTEDAPYILHRDEFWAEEKDYDQSTLTYYAGDDVLVDQDNKDIPGYRSVTGILMFGHGSGDQNVVYIRNDKQSAEYEVLRDEGSYSEEILGVQLEEASERSDLRHSVRKFRPKDD